MTPAVGVGRRRQ